MWSGTEKGSNKGRMERGEWDKQEERRLGEQSRCDFQSVLASHSPTALVSALLPHKSQLHGPLVRCSQLCPVPLTPEPVHPRLSPSVSSSHLCPPRFLPPVLCVTAALVHAFGRSSFVLECIQRASVELQLCTRHSMGAVDTQLNRCQLWDQAGQSLTQEINQKTEDEISDFNVSDIERTGESGIWSGFGVRLSL